MDKPVRETKDPQQLQVEQFELTVQEFRSIKSSRDAEFQVELDRLKSKLQALSKLIN